MNNTGIILLAAGASTRLGQPKQLLSFHKKSLLRYMAQTAVDAIGAPVLVVLGANAGLLEPEVNGLPVHVVKNQRWSSGMASSIVCGLSALEKIAPSVDRVIFMVCDQPFVSASLLKELVQQHRQTGKPIVACSYQQTIGTPALFTKQFFPELHELKGAEGAKKILLRHADMVAALTFPLGAIDIDTPDDCAAFYKNQSAR